MPGLPGALPMPGKVAQFDPAKRAKLAENVPKPMSEPIDLPAMGAMGAPRAPSEFAGPDKGGNSGFQKVTFQRIYIDHYSKLDSLPVAI